MQPEVKWRTGYCLDPVQRLGDWVATDTPLLSWIEPWPAVGEGAAPPPLSRVLPVLDCPIFEARLFRLGGGIHVRALDPGSYRYFEYRYAADPGTGDAGDWQPLEYTRLETRRLPVRRDWDRFGLSYAGPMTLERIEFWNGTDLALWHLVPGDGEGADYD